MIIVRVRCEVCNELFDSQEEYDEHWRYILDTPRRQYNELLIETNKKLMALIKKNKDNATPS